MKNIFFCLCIVAGLFSSCSSDKPRYTVNLDKLEKRQSMLASDMFKSVRVIPLETREDVSLGRITRLQVVDNKMFVLDSRKENGVYVFDMDGNYLYAIGKMGEGSGEFSSVTDFTIDETNKTIYLFDNLTNMLVYDLNNGIYQQDIHIHTSRGAKSIQFLDDRIFTDANSPNEKPDLLYQLNSATGEEEKGWIDANRYNRGWIEDFNFLERSFFYSRNSDAPKYVQLFMNTVFSLEDGKVKPFLTVESERWMSDEEVQDMKQSSLMNVNRYLSETYSSYTIYGWVENDNLISFSLFNPYCQVYVDRKNGESVVLDRVIDNLVYTVSSDIPVQTFDAADENGFYAVHSLPQTFKAREWELDQMLNPRVEKREILIDLPEKSNPIVFYYQTR